MPAVTLTTAGATALLSAGTMITHLQFSSDTIASGDLAGTTSFNNVLATVTANEAIIGVESQFSGVDDSTAAYMNFRALGVWAGDPSDADSVLLAVGSTGDTSTYGDKVADIDLHVTGSLMLTAAQATNLSFTTSQVVGASETVAGITRYATDAEVTNRSAVSAAVKPDQVPDTSGIATNAAAIALRAPIASPAFTGNPTAPTPGDDDDDTSIATTEWVNDYTVAVVIHTTEASYNARSTTDGKLHIRVE